MRDNWFCEYLNWKINSCIFNFKNPFTLLFKGIISIDSIFIKFCEVTSLYSCVHWCFEGQWQGQCHKIFCFQVFFMNHLPPGLGKSANLGTNKTCYICGLSACVAICRFANFWTQYFLHFQICDLLTQICCGLKTSANLQILYFSAYKYIHT